MRLTSIQLWLFALLFDHRGSFRRVSFGLGLVRGAAQRDVSSVQANSKLYVLFYRLHARIILFRALIHVIPNRMVNSGVARTAARSQVIRIAYMAVEKSHCGPLLRLCHRRSEFQSDESLAALSLKACRLSLAEAGS